MSWYDHRLYVAGGPVELASLAQFRERDKLTGGELEFENILPMPQALYSATESERRQWRQDNWGTTLRPRSVSSSLVHPGILTFGFECEGTVEPVARELSRLTPGTTWVHTWEDDNSPETMVTVLRLGEVVSQVHSPLTLRTYLTANGRVLAGRADIAAAGDDPVDTLRALRRDLEVQEPDLLLVDLGTGRLTPVPAVDLDRMLEVLDSDQGPHYLATWVEDGEGHAPSLTRLLEAASADRDSGRDSGLPYGRQVALQAAASMLDSHRHVSGLNGADEWLGSYLGAEVPPGDAEQWLVTWSLLIAAQVDKVAAWQLVTQLTGQVGPGVELAELVASTLGSTRDWVQVPFDGLPATLAKRIRSSTGRGRKPWTRVGY